MPQPSLLARATTLVVLAASLGACQSGGSNAAATVPAGTASSTTPPVTSSPASSTPAAAAVTSASSAAVPTPVPTSAPVSSDPYVRRALELLPGSDAATVTELRTMVCSELDAKPTRSGAEGIVSGLVEQSGLSRAQAQEIVRIAASSGCAKHTAVTR